MTRTRNRRSCNVNRREKAYLQSDAASAVNRKDGILFTTAETETKGLTKQLQTDKQCWQRDLSAGELTMQLLSADSLSLRNSW